MTATPPPSGARRDRTARPITRSRRLPAIALPFAVSLALVIGLGAVPAVAATTPRPATAVTLPPATAAPATGTAAASPTVPAGRPTAATTPATLATDTDASARGLRTPEAASKNLWDAWRDDDRPRALLYASVGAVRTLFAHRWDAEIRNQGCGRSNGTARCLYTEGALAYVVTVSGSRTAGYRVSRVDLLGRDAATAGLEPGGTTPATPTTTGAASTGASRTSTTVAGSAGSGSSGSGSGTKVSADRTPATLATGSASAAVRRADAPTPVAVASGPVGQVSEGDAR